MLVFCVFVRTFVLTCFLFKVCFVLGGEGGVGGMFFLLRSEFVPLSFFSLKGLYFFVSFIKKVFF